MKGQSIDDEPIARKGMKRLVDSRNELELLASFGNAETAEEFLEDNDVDLIFLDIEMPEINGIEFAGRIPRECLVIFTTAYSEYALDSYEVEAIDYLVKPIDPARFNRAVDKAISYHALLDSASVSAGEPAVGVADHIIVKADRRYVKINLDDIVYIEGLKDYVIIHLPEKRVVTRLTLKGIEEVIPASGFIRVNKSYIVSRNRIDSFDSNDVFIGDTEISIGASYREAVLSSLLGK
ncbi:MAG: LytTR family DNA-binding domain-containing protein [Muribaculaceae bacterium]|nr:LytTR family DNA-binding domain-containing protein [Muribaculaceae bacterium]